jgi:hypothetical protein
MPFFAPPQRRQMLPSLPSAYDLLPLPAGNLVEVSPVSRIAQLETEELSFKRGVNSRQLSAFDCA